MTHTTAIYIGLAALVLVLILLARNWMGQPEATMIRYKLIDNLWNERERVRYAINNTPRLTNWEKTVMQNRVDEINEELIRLGVPRENLQ